MKKERVCVYAGSFDPLTNGHFWMIEQGVKLFDKLIIAIGDNPDKKYSFCTAERLEMIKDAVKDFNNVRIDSFCNKLLVNYAKEVGAEYILRGARNMGDFNFEQGMSNINRDIDSNITTVILMPPREMCEISSSLVKGLIGPKGWEKVVCKYVPAAVFAKLK